MRFDVGFILKNLPSRARSLKSARLACAPFDAALKPFFTKLGRDHEELANFQGSIPAEELTLVVVRDEAESEAAAVDRAHFMVSGILDGCAVVCEERPPEICPLLFLRREARPHALIRLHKPKGYVCFKSQDEAVNRQWAERQDELLGRLLGFFGLTGFAEPGPPTALGRQLLYCGRMFRHGMAAEEFGIEFFCKFSALEGLVCGGVERNKAALLRGRLAGLFAGSDRDVPELVQRLWKKRCVVAHEAMAFDSQHLPDSVLTGPYNEDLDWLFTGALVFALDHINAIASVEELWAGQASYFLPTCALIRRDPSMMRVAATNFVLDPSDGTIRGLTSNFDQLFTLANQQLNSQAA